MKQVLLGALLTQTDEGEWILTLEARNNLSIDLLRACFADITPNNEKNPSLSSSGALPFSGLNQLGYHFSLTSQRQQPPLVTVSTTRRGHSH